MSLLWYTFLGDFMKIKALFKKYWGYILAFVSSLVVISILFYLQGVAPFGGKSLLTIDFFSSIWADAWRVI